MTDKGIRTLAAVMFTDIVGYTAMMQDDEAIAKKNRDRHREIVEQMCDEYGGVLLQYYGDGSLSAFGSAIESCRCAIAIQRRLRESPAVPLRIGIHLGDIVYEDDGVYGDAVNISARIQNLGIPGSVLISSDLYNQIENHPELSAVPLGRHSLKNVKKPVEIFAVTAEGISVPDEGQLIERTGGENKTIAVLPFVNMSSDPENEYFSDGITEELLNALAKVEGLKVTARTSSFSFKQRNEDIRDIGKRLGVGAVLEGSVRKAGKRVRITAQLINTSDGFHIWSEVFDRNLEDIFEVQDEISCQIATRLQETFGNSKPQIRRAKQIENIDAYNHYLKGNYLFNKWTPDNFNAAIKQYEKAIELEPEFSAAYAGLASCYVVLGAVGFTISHNVYPKAEEYARRAMEIDPNNPQPYIADASLALFYEWDWDRAIKNLEKAEDLGTANSNVHYLKAIYHVVTNDTQLAVDTCKIALANDPLSLPINHALSDMYMFNGEIEKAAEQHKKTLELDDNFISSWMSLAFIECLRNNFDEGIAIYERMANVAHRHPKVTSNLGFAYALAGRKDKALEIANEVHDKISSFGDNPDRPNVSMELGAIYILLDETAKAFEYLDIAFDMRTGGFIFMFNHPVWRQYNDHPRVIEYMKRMNLYNYYN
jgi:TolB-like protein/Tfp pilus assembly protein PilF